MTSRDELLGLLRRHRYAVQASVHLDHSPQAAVVGVAVADDLSIVFDSLEHTRKIFNLRRDPRTAFVFGLSDEERTVQVEGEAEFPAGLELEDARAVYFSVFPEGRDRLRWPGIVHVRVRPRWIRVTDYTPGHAQVRELGARELGWMR